MGKHSKCLAKEEDDPHTDVRNVFTNVLREVAGGFMNICCSYSYNYHNKFHHPSLPTFRLSGSPPTLPLCSF